MAKAMAACGNSVVRLAQSWWVRACCTWRTRDENAYTILGLQKDCSLKSIRAAFRKLAKATHPDLQSASGDPAITAHFVRVLAAYQILADPQKRALYDAQLEGQAQACEDRSDKTSQLDIEDTMGKDMEVVEWLKHYRSVVAKCVNQREIGEETGFHPHIRGELQSALKKAYHGPPVFESQGIPDCFEAEERAQPGFKDILHLVSGRQVFGFVRQVHPPQPMLLQGLQGVLPLHQTCASRIQLKDDCQRLGTTAKREKFSSVAPSANKDQIIWSENQGRTMQHEADAAAYGDLELHLFGKVIARATRLQPPGDNSNAIEASIHDCVSVYLVPEHVDARVQLWTQTSAANPYPNYNFLGAIHGLGTCESGRVCAVHGPDGKRTHKMLQHKTPLVKHWLWYKEGGCCECRCRRACMLPSRFWIFEPRCATHNVGGWYIETFGPPKPGHVPSNYLQHKPWSGHSRFTEGATWSLRQEDGRLHPAMYIMAAAYKTLDEEAAQIQNKSLVSKTKDMWDALPSFQVWWKKIKLHFL